MTMVLRPAEAPLMTVQPSGWPSPDGCSHAVIGTGTFIFVSAQTGADHTGRVTTTGLVAQARQALRNIRTLLAEVGAHPGHIAQMTWYVLDMEHYRARLKELRTMHREEMGSHYPATTLIEVSGLADPEAIVEITATAILPADPRPLR